MAKKTKQEEELLEDEEYDEVEDLEEDFELEDDEDIEEDDEDDEEEEVKAPPKKSTKAPAKKSTKVEEDDEDDEDIEEDDEDDEDIEEDDEDDEDIEEDDEDDEEDDEDDEEEEVKAPPKKSTKAPAKKSTKTPAKKSTKVEEEDDEDDDEDDEEELKTKKPTKTSSKKSTSTKTSTKETAKTEKKPTKKVVETVLSAPRRPYDEVMEDVKEKADNYNRVMEARAAGKTENIASPIISKELLYEVIAAVSNNADTNDYLKKFLLRIMSKFRKKFGFDWKEMQEEINNFNFSKNDTEFVFNAVTKGMYDVLETGAGFFIFRNEDCKFSVKGEWTDEKVTDTSAINEGRNSASKIGSYLKIRSKSPAPENKKVLGSLVKGKFVANKASSKNEPAKASAKKASKEVSKKKKK